MTKDLVPELLAVASAISRGEIPEYQHNECYTYGAFDLLLLNVRGAEAFDLLSSLCERFESVRSTESGLKGYYWLLMELARNTCTTEPPSGLEWIVRENPEFSSELRKWYRISG